MRRLDRRSEHVAYSACNVVAVVITIAADRRREGPSCVLYAAVVDRRLRTDHLLPVRLRRRDARPKSRDLGSDEYFVLYFT